MKTYHVKMEKNLTLSVTVRVEAENEVLALRKAEEAVVKEGWEKTSESSPVAIYARSVVGR